MKKRLKMQCFALFFLLCVGGIAHAQVKEQIVTVNLQNATLSKVFSVIEKQTTYHFSYRDLVIDNKSDITISKTSVPVSEVLSTVLAGRNLEYTIISSKSIVITDKQLNAKGGGGSVKKVSGSIKDEKGEPIIGASVMVKGTGDGTTTDVNGNYFINVPEKNAVLEVSYIGYEKQTVKVNSEQQNVVMLESAKTLDEVVVVGYGTMAKKNVVGAIDKVSSKSIEDRPVSNVTQALQGVSSSVVVQQKDFNPNSGDGGLNINIRGISTLSSNQPLVVVDGLVVDGSTLNILNPTDIENISILKDAGSAAIYGSRSANGVILVTTKKGKKNERPIVTLNTAAGYQDPHILFRPVKGFENAILRNQAAVNSGSSPVYTPEEIRDFYNNGDSEWMLDQILKSALQQNYNLSVSGGSTNSTYRISGGYFDQASNFIGPDYGVKRYNLRTNITSEYGRFKVTGLLAYTRTDSKDHASTTGFLLVDSYRIPTYYYYKAKTANGRYLVNDVLTESNPIALLESGGTDRNEKDNFSGSVDVEFKIFKGFKLKGVYGFDLYDEHNLYMSKKIPFYSSEEATMPSIYANSDITTSDYNGRNVLQNSQLYFDYDRTFNESHHVTALLGVSNESSKYTGTYISEMYTDPDLGIPTSDTQIDVGSYTTPQSTDQTALNSAFGRVGYSYKDKYYGEFNFRYDGSSKFSKNKRWCFFPSLSMGWRISDENFMNAYKNNFGDLKFRSSYGILGNQAVNNYQYQTSYSVYTGAYGFNNNLVSGATMNLGNSELKWESTATFNAGLDATFFKNSLTVSLDYFNKYTTDILLTPTVPSLYGGSISSYNAGEMRNQGWELNIGYRLKTKDFTHNFAFNLGDSWNKVTKYTGNELIISGDADMQSIIRVGEALNSYYGYVTDGYFQNVEDVNNSAKPVGVTLQPGDVKYKDIYEDGVIDSKDRVILGNAFPRYSYGFTYDVAWKGFDFSMLVQGVGKRDIFLRGELLEPYHANYSFTMYTNQLDYWTPTNPDAEWPRLSASGSASDVNNYQKSSSLHVFDGAYLRLKNIQLGYSLPKAVITKFGLNKVRAYVNAQNMLTLCKTTFVDPETTEYSSNMTLGGANSARNYPTLVYYGCGLDIEF